MKYENEPQTPSPSTKILVGDISQVKADAIVCPAEFHPEIRCDIEKAIYEAAGKEQLLALRTEAGDIFRGEVAVTPACALCAKYVFHTVPPVWYGGDAGEMDTLRNCYSNSLQKAAELKCQSVAFPLLKSDSPYFEKYELLDIALSIMEAFLMEHEMEIFLVVPDQSFLQVEPRLMKDIREYVEGCGEEGAWGSGTGMQPGRIYTQQDFMRMDRERGGRVFIDTSGSLELPPDMLRAIVNTPTATPTGHVPFVDEEINKVEDDRTFQQRLFEIIDQRGKTDPEVYKNYVSKQVFSKLRSDENYRPSKYTAVALCLSLHLDLDETQDLIGRAGWTLGKCKPDIIIRACINKKEYNLVKVNIILSQYGWSTLDKIF